MIESKLMVFAGGPCSRTWAAQPQEAGHRGGKSAQSVEASCRSATPVREPEPPGEWEMV